MRRRDFLAGAAAACFNIGCVSTRPRICGKGRRLRLALVGCGGRGVNIAMPDMVKEQIVAFADPNPWRIQAAFARLRQLDPTADTSKVMVFRDYRDLFDKAAGELDAVVITTQNSQHALAGTTPPGGNCRRASSNRAGRATCAPVTSSFPTASRAASIPRRALWPPSSRCAACAGPLIRMACR